MWKSTPVPAGGHRILGIRTFGDELLAALAPLGLAAAATTALVVDLDPAGPPYPGERTLAELVEEGPSRSEMAPGRAGVAVVRNGGVPSTEAVEMVETLSAGWPAVVARVADDPVPFPVIPVRPLWPGWLAPVGDRPSVWQAVERGAEAPGPGPVLPPPGRAVAAAFLAGRRPRRSRWIQAWKTVWKLPWR